MDITKVIVPAAGLGTRFLPYTKSIPKEMLPVGNRPAIHLIAEEAIASSLNNFLIITGKGKDAITDYFDSSPYLEQLLKERHQDSLLTSVERIARAANFTYIRQQEPMGLGHAVFMARHVVGKEHCAIMLPDDIIFSKQPGIGQLMRIARQEKTSVIAVQEVPTEELGSYGVIGVKKQITPNLFQVSHLVEKPNPKDAPSNLAIVGRYVLSHKIFPALEQISSYATSELQLTDAISCMLHNNERVFAYKIQGTRHDLGTPVGWLKANIQYGMQNPEIAHQLRSWYQSDGSLPLDMLF
jgi:UTP--glucose-1-phosphate uridylyltransferase